MFFFHFWTLQATLSDNMLNWFNFDPYLCNCIKVVLSIIWQACYKLCKIFFLYSFYRPNEKTAKIWCFAPTVLHYIHWWSFHMNLSIYNNRFKYNQNLSSYQQQKYTSEILCHNCTLLLKNTSIGLVQNEPLGFFQKM